MTKYYQCKECFTLHYGITHAEARAIIRSAPKFFRLLLKEKKEVYTGGEMTEMHTFESYHMCGNNYTLFVDAVEPLQTQSSFVYPIIHFNE